MKKILGSVLLLIGVLLPGLSSGQGSELDKAVGELADKLAFSRKGDVVGVEGDTIYISLGWQEGVLEGTKFEVVRLGEFLRTGDRKETLIAEVEVVRAREKTSIAKVTQRKEAIKEGDRAYELRKKITRIAVTEFPFRDKFNALTRNVQDILYTTLIQKGITVIEREKLEEVLREQKTGTTGVIDLSTAAQMGKLLGVEAVVVGSISDLGNSLAMIGRLVDVEKGVALSAGRIEVAKTPMFAELAKTDIRDTRLGSPPVPPKPPGPPGPVAGQPHLAELREDQPGWVINGNNYNLVDSQLSSKGLFTAYVGDASWDNYAVEFDVKQLHNSGWERPLTVLIRRQSDTDYVGLQLYEHFGWGSKWVIAKEKKETVVVNSEIKHDYAGHYRIEVDGTRYKLFKDGSQMFVFNNKTFVNGGVGLKSVGNDLTFTIDNFKVVSLRR